MVRASLACSCCPAAASAPATWAKRLLALVGDGAGYFRGLLVLPGCGQRPRDLGQGLGPSARVGDGGGKCLSAGYLAEGGPDGR